MAATPPQYQQFNGNWDDYVKKAADTVGAGYDTQIAGQQANVPLIQQQYANLAKSIQDDQNQQVSSMQKGAENSIGSTRLSNALRGVFSSSENRADERNTRANFDTNTTNLAAKVANTLAQNQTQESQQEQAIRNLIAGLSSDKQNAIQSTASQLYSNDANRWDAGQQRAIDEYWKEYDAASQEKQNEFNNNLELKKLALAQGSTANDQANATSQLMANILAEVPDGANQQDYVYRQILNNQDLWKKQGINVDDLWQVWRNLNYGSKYGTGLSQAQINAAMQAKSPKTTPVYGNNGKPLKY